MDYTLRLPDDKESQQGAADDVAARDSLVSGFRGRDVPAPASLAHDGSVHQAWARERCSIRRALEVAGNRSALLIMREAFYGTTRFDDFAGRAGISEPVTATRLRDLVDQGLLRREPYRDPGQRTRMAYRLTDMGADLLPVLIALLNWGDRWLADGAPPVAVRHHGCGGPIRAELRCALGHRLGAADLDLAAGSG
ncbi:MAG: winged helix-turn-helix transcriptional regulator, partial [Streptosporangiaceae bacterium]